MLLGSVASWLCAFWVHGCWLLAFCQEWNAVGRVGVCMSSVVRKGFDHDMTILWYLTMRTLLAYWHRSKNEGSIALAIGLLSLAKLNRSIENFDFLLSIALLGQTKSTIARFNSAIDFLGIKNDKNAIHYWAIGQTKSQPYAICHRLGYSPGLNFF